MSTKDIIKNSVLENFTADISLTRVCISLGLAVVLSLYMFYIYRMTTKSSFYSKEFNKSIALMSVITAAIVLAMQSNLVISLGMVGALSIVRFRNAIKSSMDLVFLFWSISIGIICGAGLYEIAFVASLILTVLLFLLDLVPTPKAALLLIVNSSDVNTFSEIENLVKSHTKSFDVKSKSLTKDGLDLVIEFKCKENEDATLLAALHELSHVTHVSILSQDGERRF